MKLILGGRSTGKTTRLIEELQTLAAAREGRALMLVASAKECGDADRIIVDKHSGDATTPTVVTKSWPNTAFIDGGWAAVGVDVGVPRGWSSQAFKVDVLAVETPGPLTVVDVESDLRGSEDLVGRLRASDGFAKFTAGDGEPALRADIGLLHEAADWIEAWDSKVSEVLDAVYVRCQRGGVITGEYLRRLASGVACTRCRSSGLDYTNNCPRPCPDPSCPFTADAGYTPTRL